MDLREKRRWPRAKVIAEIRWSRDEAAAPKLKEKISNIGAGGVCLTTKERLTQEDRLHLEVDLPTGNTIRAKARVVWVDKFEIESAGKIEVGYYTGVEFTDIIEEDRAKIEKFVAGYMRDILKKPA